MGKTWFADWFDTKYYHILYGNKRSDEEAEIFIQSLNEYLKFESGLHAWDMSCGMGRHARALHDVGFNVTATDLSQQSINKAKQLSNLEIDFFIQDMRHFFRSNYFDLVGNFFTSIGYFKYKYEDERIIKNAYTALKPNGVFVLDFFNASKIRKIESTSETKTIDGIQFIIRKYVSKYAIHKEIIVSDNDREVHHEEKVFLYTIEDLKQLLKSAGFRRIECFGNYKLEAFADDSERSILIAIK